MQLACIYLRFFLLFILIFLLVAVIIGHLHFFLMKESSDNKPTLEQAVQIYLESTCNNAVNLQTVENLFKASSVDDAFLKVFKHSHVDKNLLVKGAVQIALDNLLCMNFRVQLLLHVNKVLIVHYDREMLRKCQIHVIIQFIQINNTSLQPLYLKNKKQKKKRPE